MTDLKNQTFIGTLVAAFSLVFNNLLYIFKYFALIAGLLLLLLGVILGFRFLNGTQEHFLDREQWSEVELFESSTELGEDLGEIARLLYFPFVLLVNVFFSAIVLDKFHREYSGSREEVSFRQTVKKTLRRFFPLVFIYLLSGLGTLGGYLLAIMPGIIFQLAWSLAPVALTGENKGVVDSLRRSWQMTRGSRWRILLMKFLMEFLLVALYVIGLFIFFMVASLSNIDVGIQEYLAMVYSVIVLVFFKPVNLALYLVIFYNLKIRKEGYVIESLTRDFAEEITEDF